MADDVSPPAVTSPLPVSPDHESREGARSALVMAGGRLALQLVALLTTLILPWILPAEDYGRFVSVVALLSLGAMFVELGLGWIEMRFMAPAWRSGDRRLALLVGSTTFFLRMALDLCVTLTLVAWLGATPGLGLGAGELVWVGIWVFGRLGTAICAGMHLPLGYRGTFVGLEVARASLHLLGTIIGFRLLGLYGAFALLALANLALSAFAVWMLRRRLPVRLGAFSLTLLREHQGYLFWTGVAAAFTGIQFWLPVFLVGGHLDLGEAAVLGVAIQVLGVLHGLGTGMRQGLMPIIAKQQADHREGVSLAWIALMIRLVTAVGTAGLLVWLVIGREFLALMLPPTYAGLYQDLSLLIPCFVALNAAASSDMLLNLQGQAAASVANLALFAVLTVGGTGLVVFQGWAQGAVLVSGIYLIAATGLAFTARQSLVLRVGLRLPMGRALLLALPGVLALPTAWLDRSWPLWIALPILLLYLGYVFGGGLVRMDEVRRIRQALFS